MYCMYPSFKYTKNYEQILFPPSQFASFLFLENVVLWIPFYKIRITKPPEDYTPSSRLPKFSGIYSNNPPVHCSLGIDANSYSSQATPAYIVYSLYDTDIFESIIWDLCILFPQPQPQRETDTRLSTSSFFNESAFPVPLSIPLGSFLI